MEDVKLKYYVVALIDENDPDEHYYVGVEPWAVDLKESVFLTWTVSPWKAVYLTTDIEEAAKVTNAAKAVYLAEAANEQFFHFGRAHIASTAVSIKWTVV